MQKEISPKEYRKFFTTHAALTCLHSDFLLHGSVCNKADAVIICKDGVFDIFFNKNNGDRFRDGVDMLLDKKRFKKYVKDFDDYVDFVNKNIVQKYKEIPKKLTKEEFSKDIEIIGKFWYYYSFTEFPYMDRAYEEMLRKHDKIVEGNLNYIATDLKIKGRKLLNIYFFKDGVIENLLGYMSREYLTAMEDGRYLYSDELVSTFDGKIVDKSIIKERKKCYATAIINGRVIRFSYKQALGLNKKFIKVGQRNEIKGITANRGVARGRAIISPMLHDHQEIEKINNMMKKGDILIAETTSPDTIMLCNKARAIVAEQSGLLSHAAIISRELGIPCIIQAETATRIFKNGDMVEVDADKGLVRKI